MNAQRKRPEKNPTAKQKRDMIYFVIDALNEVIIHRDIGQTNKRVISYFNNRYRIAKRIQRLIERTEVRE